MKMKKLARVFTSAALVSAMVATMGGMTAFAGVGEIDLTKTITTDGQTFAPNTSFTFTITATGGSDGNVVEADGTKTGPEYGAVEGQELTVYKGIQGALNFKEDSGFSGDGNNQLAFTPADDNGAELPSSFTNRGKLTVNASVFKQPGIYHYTVNEEPGTYEGIVYDKAVRHVYLYVNYAVENGQLTDRLEVGNVVVSKEVDGEEVKVGGYEINSDTLNNKGIEFTNNYGDDSGEDPKDPENPKPEEKNDSTHDITIGKTVTGNQGDKNKVFNFKVTVNGTEGEKYKVVKTSQGETEPVVVDALTSGTEGTYQLKHGETIKITGLTENDTYTVVETEANQDGYTTTYTPGEGATRVVDGNTIQAVAADGAQYTVTNDRAVTTPTGIVLSFAPYILLVALAGVFGVLFLRRRKEEF